MLLRVLSDRLRGYSESPCNVVGALGGGIVRGEVRHQKASRETSARRISFAEQVSKLLWCSLCLERLQEFLIVRLTRTRVRSPDGVSHSTHPNRESSAKARECWLDIARGLGTSDSK